MERTDIAIVGGGAAGLTAAIYAARERLAAVLIDDYPGGQILQAALVDNYPGLPEISGEELGEAFRQHAQDKGAVFLESTVAHIKRENDIFVLTLDDGVQTSELRARSVIYAAGCRHRLLGVEGEARLTGHGVSYCASCDAAFYPQKTVAVVGGGNTALGDALLLSRIAETVYLIHRRDTFRASAALVEAVKQTDNIQLILHTVPLEICGEKAVTGIRLRNQNDQTQQLLQIDGVFAAVGMQPDTAMVSDFVRCDETGYVIAGEDGITSCPGLFAAGDIRTKQLRQVITAAADGANCVRSAEHYLRTRKG
ncbi:MAG: FAD-dependent oxidoreductase [Eubacteriales bacterium]|nr:FAD-dependent oxidoreductase [Eubacteriales bacterium]